MIQFLRALRQYKSLIIIILFAPITAFIFGGGIPFTYTPENPFLEFHVNMSVPQRSAAEISLRVAQVAERNFNAIPGLLSLSSISQDERAIIKLRFNKTIKSDSAYLFIQEKLDRVRLELPQSVEKIEVDRIEGSNPLIHDLSIQFKSTPSILELTTTLRPYIKYILNISPDLFQGSQIQIQLQMPELNKLKLPLSQVVSALKASGFKASIGSQNQLFFGIGDSFKSIEEIEGTIVAALGHRPLRLKDISTLKVISPEIQNGLIAMNLNAPEKAGEIAKAITTRFPDQIREIEFPLRQKVKATVMKSLLAFLLAILMQYLLQKYFFGRESRFFVTFLFNLLIVGHYAFWKSRFGPLNIFDLDVMSLTEGIGNVLWFILLARIRYYYLPEHQIKKIPRSLEQATLMTMGELLPTYVTLFAVFWMLSYPYLANSVNLPSQYLLENLFRFGFPIVISLIVVLPIVEHSGWIKNSKMSRSWDHKWTFSPRFLQWSFYLGTVVLLLLPLAYVKQPWMALSDPQNLARDFRGHGSQLEYLVQKEDFMKSKNPFESPLSGLQQKYYHHYGLTPLGLRLLPQMDLQGFALGLKELTNGTQWGYFENQNTGANQFMPLTAQASMGESRILDLFLSSGQSSLPLKSLVEETISQEPAEIYRERMTSNILVTGSQNNLKHSFENRTPTLWTDFILKEIQNHYWDSIIVLVFIYLLLAIYLNSFIRSFLLLTFLMLITSFNICLRWIVPLSFSIDSLWMIPASTVMSFAILLILTRIVDVERSRGIDRDHSISDLRSQLLMPIACSTVPFAMSFIYKPLMAGGQGFWFEGIFLGLFQLLNLVLLSRYIYPIFYLESEEFIEKKIYNTYLRWKKLQMKIWSKPS